MGTPVSTSIQTRLQIITQGTSQTTLSATVPGKAGHVTYIDWINGWCLDVNGGSAWILFEVLNADSVAILSPITWGWPGLSGRLKSVSEGYLGGVPHCSGASPNTVMRPGENMTIRVTVAGTTATNTLGGGCGYHYEVY